MKRQDRAGFTIVELLIVVVVIAILAAITVVAYRGVTARAEQARFMSGMDRWEKAFLSEKAEVGSMVGYVADGTDRTYTHPDSSRPYYQESTNPFCLPGNYPAIGDFREGECEVILSYFKPDSGGPEVLYRRDAITVRSDTSYFWTGSQATIISQLPKFTGDNVVASTASGHYSDDISGQNLGPGTGRFKDVTRGATIKTMISANGDLCSNGQGGVIPGCIRPVDTVNISYRVAGIQECGRGQKSTTPIVWTRETLLAFYDPQIRAAYGMGTIDYLKQQLREAGTPENQLDAKVEEQIATMLEMLNGPSAPSYEIPTADQSITTCNLRVGDLVF